MYMDLSTNPHGMDTAMSAAYDSFTNVPYINEMANREDTTGFVQEFYQQQVEYVAAAEQYIQQQAQTGYIQPHMIVPISEPEYLSNATPRMKAYLAAHKTVTVRRSDGANLYQSVDFDEHAEIVGQGNIFYDAVVNGLITDDGHWETLECADVEAIIPPLTEEEQDYLQTTYDTIDSIDDLDDLELGEHLEKIIYY